VVCGLRCMFGRECVVAVNVDVEVNQRYSRCQTVRIGFWCRV
jgi:hypothetical protein